jgi:hypothetical protein
MGKEIFVESERIAKDTRKNKRLFLIVVGICVAIAVLAIALWNTEQGRDLLAKLGIPVSQKGVALDENAESQPTNMLNYSASQAVASGDTKAAIAMYQTEINKTSNKEDKAELLLEISNLLWNNGEVSESDKKLVFDYAKQADELHPTPQSAAFLYMIYLKTGNTTEAERFQKLRDERGGDNADNGGGS